MHLSPSSARFALADGRMSAAPELPPKPTPKPTAAQARRMRSAARFYAVQALFQMEAADAGLETVLEEFETHRMGAEIDGVAYADARPRAFPRAPRPPPSPSRRGSTSSCTRRWWRAGRSTASTRRCARSSAPPAPSSWPPTPRPRSRSTSTSTSPRPSTPRARRPSSSTASSTTWRARRPAAGLRLGGPRTLPLQARRSLDIRPRTSSRVEADVAQERVLELQERPVAPAMPRPLLRAPDRHLQVLKHGGLLCRAGFRCPRRCAAGCFRPAPAAVSFVSKRIHLPLAGNSGNNELMAADFVRVPSPVICRWSRRGVRRSKGQPP